MMGRSMEGQSCGSYSRSASCTMTISPVLAASAVRMARAIRTALAASTGEIVIVQDADLEYDPQDWPSMLLPIIEGKADACFGSRFLGGPHRVLYYWHSVGNTILTTFCNMLVNLNLTD